MLNPIRQWSKRMLRRWPRVFSAAKHGYGTLTYRLRIPHDPDFAFFRNFSGNQGLVVDVGANTGQSARSIRIFNASLKILSFEPNTLLEPELRATQRMLGPGFDYRMVGLGRRKQTITLYCPVAGSTPLTPWATADLASLERNRTLIESEVAMPVSVSTVQVAISRFDDLDLHPLAIKIDVEGLELDVLNGMRETLQHDEPVLMIECSASTPEVATLLATWGYHTYQYDPHANTLEETDDPAATTNYFALTPATLERLVDTSPLKIVASRRASNGHTLAV